MEIASNVGGGSLDDARGSGKFGDDSGNPGMMSGLGGLTDEGTYNERSAYYNTLSLSLTIP